MHPAIRLLLADVDGTLVNQDKVLTEKAVEAAHQLREAGVLFAVTSGRPPRGMSMLVEPLNLETPIAAFNGGILVDREMHVIEQHVVPEHLVEPISDLMKSFNLDVWIYRGADWYVTDVNGPHVAREAWTVRFDPKVRTTLAGLTDRVAKVVGVSDDHEAVTNATADGPGAFRQPRHGGSIPAVLPRRHASRCQQGGRRTIPGQTLRALH